MFTAVPFFALDIISRIEGIVYNPISYNTRKNTNIMSEATVSQTGYIMKINIQPDI